MNNVINFRAYKLTKETKAHNERASAFDWDAAIEAVADDDCDHFNHAANEPQANHLYWVDPWFDELRNKWERAKAKSAQERIA